MPPDQMGMGDQLQPASGGMGGSAPSTPPTGGGDDNKGPNTIFLSQEALGGKHVKKGDTLTLTIQSVDPETGDAEAAIGASPEGGDMGEGNMPGEGYEAAFDKAMPPESGESAGY